jgi:hypothetical protein
LCVKAVIAAIFRSEHHQLAFGMRIFESDFDGEPV